MKNDLETVFGDVLKMYRTEHVQLSQMKLAAKAGMHINAIAYLERGTRKPSIHTLWLLCEAMNVSPVDFIKEMQKRNPQVSLPKDS